MSKKHTIEFIKSEFEKRNYNLISTEYKGAHSKLEYICDKDHHNFISWNHFNKGVCCSECAKTTRANNIRHSYEFIKSEFKNIGYTLLTKEYTGSNQKLEYICNNGHKNEVSYDSFKQGNRCSKCYGNKKLTYEFVKEQFEKEGYKLLSTEYKNNRTKLEYICDNGHINSVIYADFSIGHKCQLCYNNRRGDTLKLDYTYVKNKFDEAGYDLLSKTYTNSQTYLNYICDKGHINTMTWNNFDKGARCPQCSNRHSKAELEIYELIKSYFPNTQKWK